MKTDIERKPFQQTSHTALLIAFLSPLAEQKDHRVVSFEELSEAAHVDDIRECRHYLIRAIRRILKDKDAIFISVAGVGIKLATDGEAVEIGARAKEHITRTARRAREKSAVIDLNKLSNAEKLKSMTNSAFFSLYEIMGRRSASKRIESAIAKSGPVCFEAQELMRIAGVKQIEY